MVGEGRHAKVNQLRPAIGRSPFEAVELGHRSVRADLKSFDLAEPAVGAGLADALAEVLDDLQEAGPLARIHLEDRSTDALIEATQLGAEFALKMCMRATSQYRRCSVHDVGFILTVSRGSRSTHADGVGVPRR
ncbi:hypothetical protein [Streptomyces sp. ADI95-16]|uniref:hypothetical protein n=1 Tax=Streptomyces sp. ADI95-16 TaxID=1522758 RepID=UPI001C20060F|nr:hypothetical protein [Streptomyces sp. ADI95-16]